MTSELLREIRENPEVRNEARRLILTDALLEQPEEVRGIAETQQQMVEVMGNMTKALEQVVGQLKSMDARLERMDTRLDNGLGELKGSVVENKAERRLQQLVPSRYGLHSPAVVAGEVAEHGPTQRFLEACRRSQGHRGADRQAKRHRPDHPGTKGNGRCFNARLRGCGGGVCVGRGGCCQGRGIEEHPALSGPQVRGAGHRGNRGHLWRAYRRRRPRRSGAAEYRRVHRGAAQVAHRQVEVEQP